MGRIAAKADKPKGYEPRIDYRVSCDAAELSCKGGARESSLGDACDQGALGRASPQSARFHRVCFEIWQHGSGSPSCHVRPDLIGTVAEFDGDHFIVDFTRREVMRPAADAVRRR